MKEACPSCDSQTGFREILYGMPVEPIDESRYFIGGCCIPPSAPIWACVDCDWMGFSLKNSKGFKLSDWKCPVCESVGEIQLLTIEIEDWNQDQLYIAENLDTDLKFNAICSNCSWSVWLSPIEQQLP